MSDRGGGVNHRPCGDELAAAGKVRGRRGSASAGPEAPCREPLVAVPVATGAVAGTVGFDDEAAGNRKSTMKGATGPDGARKGPRSDGRAGDARGCVRPGSWCDAGNWPGPSGWCSGSRSSAVRLQAPCGSSPCQGEGQGATPPKVKTTPRNPRTLWPRAWIRPLRATSACGEAPSVPCRRSLPSG